MKFKSNIVRLINVTLLLLCSYFILEYISSLKVEAIKITLPKILNKFLGKTGSYDLKHEEQKSIPKGNICMNLGQQIANNGKIIKQMEIAFKCIQGFEGRTYQSIRAKIVETEKKCSSKISKMSSMVKNPSLDCIFCYKEIVEEAGKKSEAIKDLIKDDPLKSKIYIHVLVSFIDKFLRNDIGNIDDSIRKGFYFKAYSLSRDLCFKLALFFNLWNRVTRDYFWPYIMITRNYKGSRFPVEYGKF